MKFLWIIIGLVVFLGVGVGLPAWQLGYFTLPGETIPFTVQKGENFALLAKKLQSQGVIQSERAFRWYVAFSSPSKSLKRGEFGLYKNMPIPQVVRALTEGKPMEYKFTVPEGFNLYQIAESLEAKGFAAKADFIAAAKNPEVIRAIPTLREGEKHPRSIEGYIYPDTYLLQKVFSAREIAQLMVVRFRDAYKQIAPELAASATVAELGLSPHEVVVLASIVEKETGAAEERPLIASVFTNRLRKRMRLQTDPTIIYGIYDATGAWNGNIRRRDLDEKNDYNTYQMNGLPAGPIANPGTNAIRAVLNPATSDFLFFVSKNNGTHIFSKDYGAHNRAVQETQLKRSAREGKSWRDLPAEQRAR
jgi:UPF0755 protein